MLPFFKQGYRYHILEIKIFQSSLKIRKQKKKNNIDIALQVRLLDLFIDPAISGDENHRKNILLFLKFKKVADSITDKYQK